jgi:ubiquinone/menaquinone biosynthesis C-methylase UbiE
MQWTHEIRRVEFDGMIRCIPLGRDSSVLELGCGDGFQLGLLRERFARVFAIDPQNAPDCAQGFTFAFAEALPFGDCTFDLIVSNCVLEHLQDRRTGLEEAVRVLRPGGYMAHVVLACYWKAASLLLNPIGYPIRVLEKWYALRQTRNRKSTAQSATPTPLPTPSPGQVLTRWLYPPLHGTFPSHFAECRAYRRAAWLDAFRHPQLTRVVDIPLFTYTQFGLLRSRLILLRTWMARHGLASSRAFILKKSESGLR